MTLPSDGSISFSQINLEMGRPANASYSLNDSDIRKLASVGGTEIQTNSKTIIPFSSLRGHAWNVVTINSVVTNYSFLAPAPGKTYGVLNITGSGVIGSTYVGGYALTLQSTTGDLFTVQNGGKIVGAGGNGAHGGASLTSGTSGGDAILIQKTLVGETQKQLGITPNVIIQNSGVIGGGGGGGGGGQWVQDTQKQNHVPISGGGGGGGAGYVPGSAGGGGNAGGYGPGQAGQIGTLTTGGGAGQSCAGQGGGNGGNGGNLGQAGQTGADGRQGTGYGPRAYGTPGGAGGKAVVGKTYLIGGTISSGSVYGSLV